MIFHSSINEPNAWVTFHSSIDKRSLLMYFAIECLVMGSNVIVWQLMLLIPKIKLQLTLQMCSPCTHIIIVQIMINDAKLHSIINKHEMDLKLYALTFNVRKCITKCRNLSFGLTTKAKGVVRLRAKRNPGVKARGRKPGSQGKDIAKVRAKRKPKSHITYSRECKKVWGSEHSHSQGNSHFERWSPGGLPKF